MRNRSCHSSLGRTLLLWVAASLVCGAATAFAADEAVVIGRPTIFWHNGEWQTCHDGVWTPCFNSELEAARDQRERARKWRMAGAATAEQPAAGPEAPTGNGIPAPETGIGHTTIGIGQPQGQIPQTTIQIGQPAGALGQRNVATGQPNTSPGPTTVVMGQPNGQIGQTTIAIGQRNGQIGQTTIGIGQPNGQIGQTTIGIGQPTIGIGQPMGGIGPPMWQPASQTAVVPRQDGPKRSEHVRKPEHKPKDRR